VTKNDFDNIDFLPEDEDEVTEESQDQNQKYEHYRFVSDKGQGLLRVDKFLSVRIEGISRNRIQQAADANSILVNGNPVKSNYKVKPQDVITLVLDWPK
jgi:23S rRNA pseudouridine1911/1915/1917 synthase